MRQFAPVGQLGGIIEVAEVTRSKNVTTGDSYKPSADVVIQDLGDVRFDVLDRQCAEELLERVNKRLTCSS